MPFDGNEWSRSKFLGYLEVLDTLNKQVRGCRVRGDRIRGGEGGEGSVVWCRLVLFLGYLEGGG
jgi:hypothetical protein